MKRKLIKMARPVIKPINQFVLSRFYKNRLPVNTYLPERVLFLAPHVDDETIGAGGTLAKWSENSTEVHVAYMTDGSKSQSDIKPELLVKRRKEEALKVKDIIGIEGMYFLDFEDQDLEVNDETIKAVIELVEKIKPSIIFVPIYIDCHPDHVATAYILSEVLESCKFDGEIWSYEINCPIEPAYINKIVDITNFQQDKERAINEFASQAIDFDGFIALSQHKTSLLELNMSETRFVETYQALNSEEYRSICNQLKNLNINYGELFKQVNKTETLLWGLFQRRAKKRRLYRGVSL